MKEAKKGSLVYHISNPDQIMVVTHIFGDSAYECRWITKEGRLQGGSFDHYELRLIEV